MDKIHQLVSFIRYFFTAKGPDRVHSPFVFNLYYYHLKKRSTYYIFPKIERLFKSLQANTSRISANDLGAGTTHHADTRIVGKLIKTSSTPSKWGEILFKISNHVKPTNSLELGTAFGKSTAYIKGGFKQMRLTTIEGDFALHKMAKENLKSLKLDDISLIHSDIDIYLNKMKDGVKYDFVFFDANHTQEATIRYFNKIIKHSSKGAVFIFDDIYWSKGMTKAWNEICTHARAKVCLDLYKMGIVFLDRDQVPEYFKLRL